MRLIMARETTTDVKMEVRMPKQCTTAKPRTGPEPKINNAMPAIKLVTFESRIVAKATEQGSLTMCMK